MARSKLPGGSPSTIALLLGRRGSGKSLAAACYAKSTYDLGNPVFYWPKGFLTFGEPFEMNELVRLDTKISGGLIVIDEAHTAMDSRRAMTFANFALMSFITQLRKRKASLIMTTQFGNTLDKRLGDQVDMHGECSTLDGGRTVLIKWKDTNGQWSAPGAGTSDKIPRKRVNQLIRRADSIWPFYDTYAVADLVDVLGLTRESIVGKTGGRDPERDASVVREAIIDAVQAGSEWLQPGNFALTIAEKYGLRISGPQLGWVLGELGLPRTKRNTGTYYQLPAREELEAWKTGALVLAE